MRTPAAAALLQQAADDILPRRRAARHEPFELRSTLRGCITLVHNCRLGGEYLRHMPPQRKLQHRDAQGPHVVLVSAVLGALKTLKGRVVVSSDAAVQRGACSVSKRLRSGHRDKHGVPFGVNANVVWTQGAVGGHGHGRVQVLERLGDVDHEANEETL